MLDGRHHEWEEQLRAGDAISIRAGARAVVGRDTGKAPPLDGVPERAAIVLGTQRRARAYVGELGVIAGKEQVVRGDAGGLQQGTDFLFPETVNRSALGAWIRSEFPTIDEMVTAVYGR